MQEYEKVDSFLNFPRTAVQSRTEAVLTSRFETSLGEPGPFGRPYVRNPDSFIKLTVCWMAVQD